MWHFCVGEIGLTIEARTDERRTRRRRIRESGLLAVLWIVQVEKGAGVEGGGEGGAKGDGLSLSEMPCPLSPGSHAALRLNHDSFPSFLDIFLAG